MGRERIEGGGRDGCTFLNYIEGKPSPSPKAVTVLILWALLLSEQGAWIQDPSRGRDGQKAKSDGEVLKVTGLAWRFQEPFAWLVASASS